MPVQYGSGGAVSADMVRAYLTAAQNVATGVATAVTWDTNDAAFTTQPLLHSIAVNPTRFTPAVAGRYLIYGVLQYASNTTGIRQVLVMQNGVTLIARTTLNPVGASFPTTGKFIGAVQLGVTDYLEIQGYQTSGGALGYQVGSGESWVVMQRVA